jgi:hypothetical protein
MADHIRLRLAGARLGATMAFFALLSGLAERARAASPPPPPANFLREISSPLGTVNATVIHKLDSALAALEHKLQTSFTTTHKLNQTFLKIKSANAEFLKLRTANTTFLKIGDANSTFLKIGDANTTFLKLDSTAANASKLGGLTPDAFFQGTGHVVSGSVAAVTGTPSQLVALPGGIIVVDVADVPGLGVTMSITNATGATLSGVLASAGGRPSNVSLAPGTTELPSPVPTPGQLQLQIFPGGSAFPQVVTVILSVELVNSTIEAVGQAFTGPAS